MMARCLQMITVTSGFSCSHMTTSAQIVLLPWSPKNIVPQNDAEGYMSIKIKSDKCSENCTAICLLDLDISCVLGLQVTGSPNTHENKHLRAKVKGMMDVYLYV